VAGEDVISLVCCPHCRAGLHLADQLMCSSCGRRYPILHGIPVLLPDQVEELGSHKARQASFFDSADAAWETTRPAGAPKFYSGLLDYRFEQAVSAIRDLLPGATVLTVCGGSGMDAEYLARTGARVIASDLSLEAARRARERGRLRSVPLTSIVADVEALPFHDRSVDLVFVHDGLHHLENPLVGLAEMARVARVAVSVNEPARAVATQLAVKIGLSEEREEAGNQVARVDPGAIASALANAGFTVVERRRYAMVYRHKPGSFSAFLSIPPLHLAASAALKGFNAVLGEIGNKLTIQAVRPEA
jgi:SAM-dependent methyltransferase